MKHASEAILNGLAEVLADLRLLPGLKETKVGTFYRKSSAFLHFHEDPSGLFADLKINGDWQRFSVDTPAQRRAVLTQARAVS
jgi:hypothetical protein